MLEARYYQSRWAPLLLQTFAFNCFQRQCEDCAGALPCRTWCDSFWGWWYSFRFRDKNECRRMRRFAKLTFLCDARLSPFLVLIILTLGSRNTPRMAEQEWNGIELQADRQISPHLTPVGFRFSLLPFCRHGFAIFSISFLGWSCPLDTNLPSFFACWKIVRLDSTFFAPSLALRSGELGL